MSLQRERLVTGRFMIITAAALSYFTAIGMLTPALPRFVKDHLHAGDVAVGVTFGAFAVSAAFVRPFVGRLGDRRGRRILVVGGTAAVAVSLLGYALAHNLATLLAARLLTGCGEAAVFVGAATAAQDLAPDSRRAEAASYFSVAVYGGQGLGPVISEWLRRSYGFGWLWTIAIVLCAVATLLGTGVPVGERHDDPGVRAPLLHPAARGPGSVLFLSLMGFGGFAAFVALYLDRLGDHNAGRVFLLYSAIVLGCRIFGARMADRRGPKQVAGVGLVLAGTGLAIAALWHAPIGVYVGTVVLAPGLALQYPALIAVCLDIAPPEQRSAVIASFSVFVDVSQGIGLPLLGGVVALTDERGAFAVGAALCYLAVPVLIRFVQTTGGSHASDVVAIGPLEPEV